MIGNERQGKIEAWILLVGLCVLAVGVGALSGEYDPLVGLAVVLAVCGGIALLYAIMFVPLFKLIIRLSGIAEDRKKDAQQDN